MANLPEVDQYDSGVYQLETTDPALAGANGVMNTPPKSLVNRTRFLLNRIIDGALKFVLDTGAQNAITLALQQPANALVDGMEVSFRVAVANTGAVTLKLTNTGGVVLATLPVYGADYAALVGGELPAGATVSAKLNLSLNTSNGGAWVIQSIAGGFAKIPTAPIGDMTTKAANMAALAAATDGISTVNVGVGANVTLTAAQYGCAILKLTGTPTAPINLVLPAKSGQWIINNQQGGTENITVIPAGGTGVILPQPGSTSGVATIVVSDGVTAMFASAQANQASVTPIPFTGVTGNTLTIAGGYTLGSIAFIEKNGYLLEGPDFSALASPNITLTTAAVATDYFTVYRFSSFTVANAVQKTGDIMSGALALAGGDTIANDPAANDNSTKLHSTGWVWRNILALVNSIIGTVTGVTAAAADNSTKLSTTAWVWNNIQALVASCIANVATAAGLSYYFSTNGYIKFPSWLSGAVFQWGGLSVGAGANPQTVTLPIAFPTAFLGGIISIAGYPYAYEVGLNGNGTNSSVSVYNTSGTPTNVYWFSWGH